MFKTRTTAKIIAGPWPSDSSGRALSATQRAGRYLPPDQPRLIISTRYDEFHWPWPSKCQLPASGRPVLQFNLPFPDMPTLGQIARKRLLCPVEPIPVRSPKLPPAAHRILSSFVDSHFYQMDPERLLQDPDWYENPPK